MDLEITNTSLLSINASLERLKLAQASEIRELRRRLRESRGFAPVTAYVASEGALSSEDTEDSEHEEDSTWEAILADDPAFAAISATLENLIKRGQLALEKRVESNEAPGGRVLNAIELEDQLIT